MKLNINFRSNKLFYLYLLLATDLAFIIFHIVYTYSDFISSVLFSIDQERGYAEMFQYIKEYWIAILLLILAFNQRAVLYVGWSLLFFYLLLDDSLEIHERLGARISDSLGFTSVFNLRAVDFGEIIVSGSVALFFLVFIGIAYRFSDRISRSTSRYLIGLLFALAVCGIVFDMLHIVFKYSILEPIFVILEDGGEMIVMSVITWFVFLRFEQLSSNLKPYSQSLKLHEMDKVAK